MEHNTSANRLASETSPYLLQHAHNPVDWYPWGDAALERARLEDKPILLSIGYAACHWCHVMERESFENAALAHLMNQHFVCVKVDREERPDLDAVYMRATMALNHGRGGWPMTVFLTPKQEPIFAGTYFPPTDRHGMPGFDRVLRYIAQQWQQQRADIMAHANAIAEALRRNSAPVASDLPPDMMQQLVTHLHQQFDSQYGGFGAAPKFPHATTIIALLRQAAGDGDNHGRARHMARRTLDGMAHGGIYDHIGGGFARYSTDAAWLVPHFEKMLYDNALLASAYLEAYSAERNEADATVAAETLNAVLRDLRAPEGGFYSSIDADSEGEEGKYYVWSAAEVRDILGAEHAEMLCAYYDITSAGNWEGKNIPHTPRPLAAVAAALNVEVATLRTAVAEGRERLLHTRRQRPAPAVDDKILTSWNGLMISAMAQGGRLLQAPQFLRGAEAAADFVLKTLRTPQGRLLRTYRSGKAHVAGYLEDYAYFAMGLIDLYESGGDATYLHAASALAERMIADFWDAEESVFYDTSGQHEKLMLRAREGHDGATPNPHATAAFVLARLYAHFDNEAWRAIAWGALRSDGHDIARSPTAFCQALLAWQWLAQPAEQWVLVGDPNANDYQALWQAIQRVYAPWRAVAHSRGDVPLLTDKSPVAGRAALYVCHHFTCDAPITDAAQVLHQIE